MPELTEEMIVDAVTPVVLGRAHGYVDKLTAVSVAADGATAVAHGTSLYQVRILWRDGSLVGTCTCPAALDSTCKHQAALGLRVIGDDAVPSSGESDDGSTLVADYLERQDRAALLDLLSQAMDTIPGVWDLVARRADMERAVASGSEDLRKRLLSETTSMFRTRGSTDYWEADRLGNEFCSYLEALAEYLDAGLADALAPSFKKATERLRLITLHSDSSSGALGDAGDLAISLYARACCEGSPDPVKLAKWLVKFEEDSPGWPTVTLTEFAPALGETGLQTLIAQVEKALTTSPDDFRLRELQLQAARLTGDVDLAARLLRDSRRYHELFNFLREHERGGAAMRALQLAIDAGQVTARELTSRVWGYQIPIRVAAEALAADGREDEVEELARGVFRREHSVDSYRFLVRSAADPEVARRWARTDALAGTAPWTVSSVRLELAIEDEEWDRVVELAAGEEVLARARERVAGLLQMHGRPRDAAQLLTLAVWEELAVANSTGYPLVAKQLKRIDGLYRADGDELSGKALVEEIRQAYSRRPSLMAQLRDLG